MNKGYLSGLLAVATLVLGALACRPVIAIGWEEFLLLFVLAAFLLGPPLYRFIRRVESFRRHARKDK
jgi:hypothetical protein